MPDEFDHLLDQIGEGVRPGADIQQGQDSDHVPAPALPGTQSPSPEQVAEAKRRANERAAEEETPPDPTPPPEAAEEPLPPDIAAVWGLAPDSTLLAQRLIAEWGLEQFRSSSIHMQALKEAEREGKMEPIRAAFIKARQAQEKKK